MLINWVPLLLIVPYSCSVSSPWYDFVITGKKKIDSFTQNLVWNYNKISVFKLCWISGDHKGELLSIHLKYV